MAAEMRPMLYYWKGRGRAENARLTCAAGGIEFDETNVYTREQFLQMIEDGKLLFKQLPLMEIDGLRLVGSESIVRYLGRKADLYGKSNEEKARIDILMMGAIDLLHSAQISSYLFTPNPEEMIDTKILPAATEKYLPAFEKTLTENGTGYLVGSSLSVADILLFDALTHITDSPYPKLASVMKNYPKCTAFVDMVAGLPGIAEYLASPKRSPVPNKEYIKAVCLTLNW